VTVTPGPHDLPVTRPTTRGEDPRIVGRVTTRHQGLESETKRRFRRRALAVAVLAILVGFTATVFIAWREPLLAVFTDRDRLSAAIRETGPYGPVVFIGVQVIQTAIAPIPGQITGIVGGAVFGWWGFVWSMIGSVIGAYLVLRLIRRFGRPLAEKIVSPKLLGRFDFAIQRQGVWTLFLMFLLPIFPDSILCYIAGLTEIPIRTLMVIWIAGRAPSALVNNLLGEGMSRAAIRPIIVVTIICVVLGIAVFAFRRQLHDFVAADNHVEHLQEKWPYKLRSTIAVGLLSLAVLAGISYVVLTV